MGALGTVGDARFISGTTTLGAVVGLARSVHRQLGVQGAITGRDVIRHSLTILRLWGPTCYVRCLRAVVSGRPCTFLEVITSRA